MAVSVLHGSFAGAFTENLYKIRSGVKAHHASDKAYIHIGSGKIIFCRFDTIIGKILLKCLAYIFFHNLTEVIRMIVKMLCNFGGSNHG